MQRPLSLVQSKKRAVPAASRFDQNNIMIMNSAEKEGSKSNKKPKRTQHKAISAIRHD